MKEYYTLADFESITSTESQCAEVPFCGAALQPLIPQPGPTSRATPFQVQNLAPAFVELHTVGDCPSPQIVRVHINPSQSIRPRYHLSKIKCITLLQMSDTSSLQSSSFILPFTAHQSRNDVSGLPPYSVIGLVTWKQRHHLITAIISGVHIPELEHKYSLKYEVCLLKDL